MILIQINRVCFGSWKSTSIKSVRWQYAPCTYSQELKQCIERNGICVVSQVLNPKSVQTESLEFAFIRLWVLPIYYRVSVFFYDTIAVEHYVEVHFAIMN